MIPLLSLLIPALLVIGMVLCAVLNRKRGHWHIHYPEQDGMGRIIGKYWLLKRYAERNR